MSVPYESQVLLPGEKPPCGEDRPYTQPITWLEWERQFGARPYDTPYDELVQNFYYPTFPQIWSRWAGMPQQSELMRYYNSPTLLADRDAFHRKELANIDVSFLDSPDYIKQQTYDDIQRLTILINRLQQILDQDSEEKWVSEGSPQEGYKQIKINVRIDATRRARLSKEIASLMKIRAAFQGRAGEVKEDRHTVDSVLGEALDKWLTTSDYRDRDGYQFSMLEKQAKQPRSLEAPAIAADALVDAEILQESEAATIASHD